ncbi:hypothetical protein ABTI69_21575, partial [Acinetobacter baumannii]
MSDSSRGTPRNPDPQPAPESASTWVRWLVKPLAWALGLGVAAGLAGVMLLAIALCMAYPNLPEL